MTKSLLRFAFTFMISFYGMQASAQILEGTITASSANNMVLMVKVNTVTDSVEISASGPSAEWFGYGFGGSNMTNRYTIITDGTGAITERKLGNHVSGIQLNPSLTSVSSTAVGATRIIVVKRSRVGASSDYFTFPNTPGTFTIIWAKGSGVNLANHGSANRGTAMLTLSSAVSVDEFTLSGVNIYPNPVTSSFIVEVQHSVPQRISVYNALGQKVLDEVSSQLQTSISIGNLPNGIYFVELVQGNKFFRQKIVKQ